MKKKNTFVPEIVCDSQFFCNLQPILKALPL